MRSIGLGVPLSITSVGHSWAIPPAGWDDSFDCRVHIRFGVEDGALTIEEIRYERRSGDPPLTPLTVRGIPVGKVADGLVTAWERAARDVDHRAPDVAGLRSHLHSQRRTRRKIDGPFLHRVAAIYASALKARRRDPTVAVAEELYDALQQRTWMPGQAPKTAQRWVSLARKRGYLGPTAERRKGGVLLDTKALGKSRNSRSRRVWSSEVAVREID